MALGIAPEAKTPQIVIEKAMQDILQNGLYDAAYLFSDEGLPLATAVRAPGNGVLPTAITTASLNSRSCFTTCSAWR